MFSSFVSMFDISKVSGVPMLEKAGMKKWGKDRNYLHYMQNTSCIVPWFPAPLKIFGKVSDEMSPKKTPKKKVSKKKSAKKKD